MNERILELQCKAQELAAEAFPGKIPFDPNPNPILWDRIHLSYEKFAELIVKECCDQLVKEGEAWEQFSRNPPEGQETNTGAALFAAYRLKEDAVSRLEEHFGVESCSRRL